MPEVIGLLAIIILIFASIALYEIRIKRPDQIILFEKNGDVGVRKGKFYFRHFNLPLSKTLYSFQLALDASAKGNIDIKIKAAVSIGASMKNIHRLVAVGGWNQNVLMKAAKELEIQMHSAVKEYAEKYELEELSSEKISEYLNSRVSMFSERLGIEINSMVVQSFEAADQKISLAMRARESARILEQAEQYEQSARIASAKSKLKADEEILMYEHRLDLKKYEIKKIEMEKENSLAMERVEDEMKKKKLQLELEREELEMLNKNPQLLLLTPQAARLAEAGQALKNAKTVVSLNGTEFPQGGELFSLFQSWVLANSANSSAKNE